MDTCSCCADVLLRHFNHGSLSWFCRSCWAEMPSVEEYRAGVAIAPPAPLELTVSRQPRLSLVPHRDVAA